MPTPEEIKEYNDFLLQTGSTSNAELEKLANELLSTNQAPSAVEETRAIGKQIAMSLMEELKTNGFMKLANDPSISPEVLVENNIDKKDTTAPTPAKPKVNPESLIAQIMATIGAVGEADKNALPEEKGEKETEEEKAASELIAKVANELVDLGISKDEAPEAAEILLSRYVEALEAQGTLDSDKTVKGSEMDELTAYYTLGREVGEAIIEKINN